MNTDALNIFVTTALAEHDKIQSLNSNTNAWEPTFVTTKNYKNLSLDEKKELFSQVARAWKYNNIDHPDKPIAKPYIGINSSSISNNLGWVLFKSFNTEWNKKVDYISFHQEFKNFILDENNTDENIVVLRKTIKEDESITFTSLSFQEQKNIFDEVLNKWCDEENNKASSKIIKDILQPIIMVKCKYKNVNACKINVILRKFRQYICGLDESKVPNAKKIKDAEEWKHPFEYWGTPYESINEKRIKEEITPKPVLSLESFYEPKKINIIRKRKADDTSISDSKKKKYETSSFNLDKVEDLDKKRMDFLKNLTPEKFKIIVKNGGFDLSLYKFHGQISINEDDAKVLGVDTIMTMSELKLIKTIEYS
jgi:hypothetical protein